MLSPFVPHITEELWNKVIDSTTSVHDQEWPSYDPEALKVAEVEILLQINGKGKGRIVVPSESTKADLEQLAVTNEAIREHLEGKKIVKVIAVPGRLVNVVTK